MFTLADDEIVFGENDWITADILFDSEALVYNYDYTLILELAPDASEYPLGTDIKQIEVTIKRSLTFSDYGVGVFSSEAFGEEWEQPLLVADQAEVYRLPDLYEPEYPIDILFNGDGTVTVDPQPAWFYNDDYGDVYVMGTGTVENGIVTMQLEHYVASIDESFGVFTEILIMPQ